MEFIKFWFPIIKVADLFLHPYLLYRSIHDLS